MKKPSAIALLFCLLSLVATATPSIQPEPQQMTVGNDTVSVAKNTHIQEQQADPDSVKLLRSLLASGGTSGTLKEVTIGERTSPLLKDFSKDIPAVSGAYRISVTKDRIMLAGHDRRGTYYAVQTLRQLIDPATQSLPAVEILDFPDLPARGVVEGFYGTPWTHENRLSQFAFYGRHKMNTYIYGPKDDPYHRAPHWRKPYPAAEAKRIQELVQAANADKVDFVWAIHPGGDINWTEADFIAARDKFESMYALGVRAFAVFFDDIGGEGTKPEKQAEFLNRLHKEFIKTKSDVAPLIMCPTEYNRSWSNPKKGTYLDILGEQLDPSIHIMWTGDRVIADMNKPSLEWVNGRIRRKAYIWWNFPVSDYVRNHLLMGPSYGNTADIGDMMSGFLSNPMERAEASKVALYGVAGYAWNLRAYNAEQDWRNAMKEILPHAPEAFLTFCTHNSDLGPNGHGYRREESVAIRPVAEKFLAALQQGEVDRDSLSALQAEFAKIAQAPAAIRAAGAIDNPELITEISPWLDAFAELGNTGVAALQSLNATDINAQWSDYANALTAWEKMKTIDRTQNRNPHQPGVKTSSLVLEPLLAETLDIISTGLLTKISGQPVIRYRPITNSQSKDGLERMIDGDEASFYYSRQIQKTGDWFGVDLGTKAPVSQVRILMGRQSGDHDIVHQGQLEYSADGKTWQPLGGITQGEEVTWKGTPVEARQIRYLVTRAGKLDGTKNDVWCAIRSFQVNDYHRLAGTGGKPQIYTSVKNLSQIPVIFADGAYALSPQLEVFRLPPNQHIGIQFPSPLACATIKADLSVDNLAKSAEVETSVDGKTWKKISITADAGTRITGKINDTVSYVRIRNSGKGPLETKLSLFQVILSAGTENTATPFTDGRLDTAGLLSAKEYIPIQSNTRGVALLFAPGSGAKARIGTSASQGGPVQALGTADGDLARFNLPAPVKFLVIEAKTPDARLHEAVWMKK